MRGRERNVVDLIRLNAISPSCLCLWPALSDPPPAQQMTDCAPLVVWLRAAWQHVKEQPGS